VNDGADAASSRERDRPAAPPPVLEYGRPAQSKHSPDQLALEFARIVAGLVLLPVLIVAVLAAAAGLVYLVMRPWM
jgi:hypothetical protein